LSLAARRRPFGYSFKGFPGWPMARSFALCAELGYSGVELVAGPHDPGEVRALTKRHKLPVLSVMEDLRLTGAAEPQLERLEQSLRLAKEIGRPVVETIVGGKPPEWEGLRASFLERLRPWAKLAERYKVPVAIKAHIGSALHTPADAAELCRQVGSPFLKLNYDFSHFQLQGMTLEQSLREALPFIAMIHVKDSTGAAPTHRFVLPGAGSINYNEYAALLDKAKYRGPIVVEVSAHVLEQEPFDAEAAARFVAHKVLPVLSRKGV